MSAKDKKQYTPLHSAAAGGQSHTAKLLLEFGADVSACVHRWVGGCVMEVNYSAFHLLYIYIFALSHPLSFLCLCLPTA